MQDEIDLLSQDERKHPAHRKIYGETGDRCTHS